MATRKRKPVRKPAGRSKPGKPDALPYSADDRNIFYFCDHGAQCHCKRGEAKCRRIDPMAVLEILEDCGGEQYQADVELLSLPIPTGPDGQPGMPDRMHKEARSRVNTVVRKAFKLAPLDDSHGVTWLECVAIMQNFSTYLEECKKKADALRISLGLAPPPSFPRTISAMPNASASNSTPAASTHNAPQAPPRGLDFSSEATQEKASGETCPAM